MISLHDLPLKTMVLTLAEVFARGIVVFNVNRPISFSSDQIVIAPQFQNKNHILNSLRTMKKTVIVPGYSDFETFGHDYKYEVQVMLDSWQKTMQVKMNNIYDHYKSKISNSVI